MKFIFSLALLFVFYNFSFSQCSDKFSKNINIGDIHSLITKDIVLVYQSSVDYTINFRYSEDDITARIITTGPSGLIKPLKKGDILIFVTSKGEKKNFTFFDKEDKTTIKNRPAFTNTIQLNMKVVKWLSENKISQIQFCDMVKFKISPFTLDALRQSQLKDVINCFASEINSLMVNGSVNDNSNIIKSSSDIDDKEYNSTPKVDTSISDKLIAQNSIPIKEGKTLKEIIAKSKIGTTFYEQMKYDQAIEYFKKALSQIEEEKIGLDIKPHIEAKLANIYFNKKQYKFASRYSSSALSILKSESLEPEDYESGYLAYLIQGKILTSIDTSELNLQLYKKSVPTSQKNWQKEIKKHNGYQIEHKKSPEKSQDFNLAFLSFINAKNLIPKLDKKEQTNYKIKILMELGKVLFDAGHLNKAKEYYKQTLKLIKSNYHDAHPKLAEVTNMLSLIALKQQSFKEAISMVDKILKDVEVNEYLVNNLDKIIEPIHLLDAIITKGIINFEKEKGSRSEEDLKKILEEYGIASKILLEIRETHRNESADYQLVNITDKLSQNAILVCDKLHKITKDQSYVEKAFEYAELAKSGINYEIHQALGAANGVPQEEFEKENNLKIDLAQLKSQLFYELQQGIAKNESKIKKLEDTIALINKEHKKLLVYFEQKYPKYHALKYDKKTVSLKDLQSRLSSDEVFLEYTATDSFIYVVAISNSEIKSQFKELPSPLKNMVHTFQYALKKNKPELYLNSGYQLYKNVIGELTFFIKGKRLIIAPDKELYYIPFGVFPTQEIRQTSKDNIYSAIHYLIQDHPICYNHSASAYFNSKNPRGNKANHQIATWAPHFDDMGPIIKARGFGDHIAPLPAAEKEAILIAKLFGNEAYIAQYATEAKFKKLANKYSILHIATHGLLDDDSPLSSALVLSNEGKEDGLLNASEIYQMHLNAEMAVLSSCNSGMGKISKGEGVIGVASGFAYAGVPNIVMSKWPVSDWSTAVLMKTFYKNLKTGMPKDVALQQAKIKYIETNKGKEILLAPFFWGAFVLHGNTEPIEALQPLDSGYLFYAIIVLLTGILFLIYRKRQQQKTNT